MVKSNFHRSSIPKATVEVSLTYEEKNALRYTAGYVPRALRKKLKKSAHPLKEELVLCLVEMTEGDRGIDESEDWVNSVDRGGLKHINEMSYTTFASMELELRRCLHQNPNPNFKDEVAKHILENEDVHFYWSMVSSEWDQEESEALLTLVVDMWVTIRGFSHASAWVEKYKVEQKKSTPKSKGLRNKLNT